MEKLLVLSALFLCVDCAALYRDTAFRNVINQGWERKNPPCSNILCYTGYMSGSFVFPVYIDNKNISDIKIFIMYCQQRMNCAPYYQWKPEEILNMSDLRSQVDEIRDQAIKLMSKSDRYMRMEEPELSHINQHWEELAIRIRERQASVPPEGPTVVETRNVSPLSSASPCSPTRPKVEGGEEFNKMEEKKINLIVDIQALTSQGEILLIAAETSRDPLTHARVSNKLQELKIRWLAIQRDTESKRHEVTTVLPVYQQFSQDKSQLEVWLPETEKLLEETIQEEDRKEFMVELTRHQDSIGGVVKEGSVLNNRWEELRVKALERQTRLQTVLMDLQQKQLDDLGGWLTVMEERIVKQHMIGADLDAIKSQVEEQIEIQKSLEEEQKKVDSLQNMVVVVDDNNTESACAAMEQTLESLGRRSAQICRWTEEQRLLLQELLMRWQQFSDEQDKFNDWLTEKEGILQEMKATELTTADQVIHQVKSLKDIYQYNVNTLTEVTETVELSFVSDVCTISLFGFVVMLKFRSERQTYTAIFQYIQMISIYILFTPLFFAQFCQGQALLYFLGLKKPGKEKCNKTFCLDLEKDIKIRVKEPTGSTADDFFIIIAILYASVFVTIGLRACLNSVTSEKQTAMETNSDNSEDSEGDDLPPFRN